MTTMMSAHPPFFLSLLVWFFLNVISLLLCLPWRCWRPCKREGLLPHVVGTAGLFMAQQEMAHPALVPTRRNATELIRVNRLLPSDNTPNCVCINDVIQVKGLHQGVLGKLQPLHPCLIAEDGMGRGHDRIRMEVQREVERRRNLATQLRNLLESQLEVGTDTQQLLYAFYIILATSGHCCLFMVFHRFDQSDL